MATYFFALLSWVLPVSLEPIQPASHLKFIILIFIITFLLPAFTLFVFKTFGTIKSYHLVDRSERIMPFVFTCSIYLIISYMFYAKTQMSIGDNFLRLLLILDLMVIVATVATFFSRVSIHSLTVWGLIGIMLPLNRITEVNTLFYSTLGVILLAGAIMSSRLQLNAHTMREVMWGSILGLASGVGGMFILFKG
jgi:membrane-associated phospholipid phosphatase